MENLANRISFYLYKKKLITKEEDPIYAYGAEVLLESLLLIVAILIFGNILGQLFNTFIFIFCFYSLRRYSGGYHADTYKKCFFISLGTYLFAISFSIWASINIFILVFSIGNVILLTTAPSQSRVNPKTKKELSDNRKKMLFCMFVMNTFIISCWYFDFLKEAYFTIGATLLSVAVLSFINYIQLLFIRKEEKL